jgi:hypothetical protein
MAVYKGGAVMTPLLYGWNEERHKCRDTGYRDIYVAQGGSMMAPPCAIFLSYYRLIPINDDINVVVDGYVLLYDCLKRL